MTSIKNRLVIVASACSLALLLAAPASVRAQTPAVLAESEIGSMGHLTVKAAHFTGKNPRLVRYEAPRYDGNEVTYSLVMEYYGAGTGKRYLAHIDVHMVKTTQGIGLKCTRVDYSDNNIWFYSHSKLARVPHQINNLLGVP
ncbi:MAG: hypothetical protein HY289_12825 [Planctomycetes bacterium]|nr:hypothetical protein [Planctomycetota bacterium]